jgi:hypothetical protein
MVLANGALTGSASSPTIDNSKDVARKIGAKDIADGTIGAADIADGTVTSAKLADGSRR